MIISKAFKDSKTIGPVKNKIEEQHRLVEMPKK